MHQNWSANIPLEMIADPKFFFAPGDMSTATPAFDEWVCENGSVESDWDSKEDDDLNWEYDYHDALLMEQWRESVANRTTFFGFDQWRENLIQAWKLQARAAEDFRRTQALNTEKGATT